ncbi:MAG: LysE family transporter [Bacteroidia bacterium]|nr:LysE family transporter [Bacteroidia bacterium]
MALLNLLAAVSPGPDFVMVVRNSLCFSRRSGIFTSLGISMALGVHLVFWAAGIGLIISKSIVLFSLIKYLGAGYLIYMGIGSILSKVSKLNIKEERKGSDLMRSQAFRMGFLTNVLNPKVTMFFLSLFSFVIGNSTPVYVILTISAIIIGTAFTWFTIVSIFLAQQNVQRAFLKYEMTINRILGGFLILLGVRLALLF